MAEKPGKIFPEKVYIEAPCKINLHLRVGEKRPDGFHDIESLFASLAFCDALTFECGGEEGECILSTDSSLGSGEDNLVYKAASLFRARTGFTNALRIFLEKRIPIGAGLGGGSSDAASTLLAMNFLAGNPASMKELTEMAAVLGSDVPFFLAGGLAFVSGRGERIEPILLAESIFPRDLSVVLVKPPFSADTAEAYRLLDKSREETGPQESHSGGEELSKEAIIRFLGEDPGAWPFRNDFLSIDNTGAYRAILESLRNAGASFAALSGSGSCCFGIFIGREMAEKVAKELYMLGNFVRLTFFLANRAKPVVK